MLSPVVDDMQPVFFGFFCCLLFTRNVFVLQYILGCFLCYVDEVSEIHDLFLDFCVSV